MLQLKTHRPLPIHTTQLMYIHQNPQIILIIMLSHIIFVPSQVLRVAWWQRGMKPYTQPSDTFLFLITCLVCVQLHRLQLIYTA